MKIEKYDINIDNETICSNLDRLINQIYKLLPDREEGIDWQAPLSTIMEELAGMDRLLIGQHEIFFSLLCKLEGLFTLTKESDSILRASSFDLSSSCSLAVAKSSWNRFISRDALSISS